MSPGRRPRSSTARVVARVVALVMALGAVTGSIACGTEAPGTSVALKLQYDDALRLSTAEVTALGRTQSAAIAHRMLLLVPEDLAGTDMPIEVWGRASGKRAAFGAVTAQPRAGTTVEVALQLAACSPGCNGAMLSTCSAAPVTCALACSEQGDAHCVGVAPANGVDPALADALRETITITNATTFNTDTGEITGGLTRAPGTGVDSGIAYAQAAPTGTGGAPLAVFAFRNLTIEQGAVVRFTGARAVVWLVSDTALIAGTVDLSAGRVDRAAPGPGGGVGGNGGTVAGGCGPGGPGMLAPASGIYSGAAGGGGGTAGGTGGTFAGTAGGVAGRACLPAGLEPLQGGSGGGAGRPVAGATTSRGGAGGGAIQITAATRIEVTGTIHAGGAGGEGGSSDDGGAGGGSGGAILLEAPAVVVTATGILAANGGGGGASVDTPGANATASAVAAPGGATSGGAGGVRTTPPVVGGSGAGGGGAVGAIAIRGRTRSLLGLVTPSATVSDVTARE